MAKTRRKPTGENPTLAADIRQPYDALIAAMRFLGEVATKIYGVLDESSIFQIVRDEFARSQRYACNILLLTEDKLHLRSEGGTHSSDTVTTVERLTGLDHRTFVMDVRRSPTLMEVILQGKIVCASPEKVVREVFPANLAPLAPRVASILGFPDAPSVLLPILKSGESIGAMGITPPEMFDDFVPSVRTFSRQLSTALDLAEADSRRKRLEQDLRTSEARLLAFLDSAADSCYLLDEELNFVEINRRGLELIGREKQEVIGRNIDDVVPDIRQSHRRERHLEVIRTGQPFVVEDFVPHPAFGDLHLVLKSFKVGDGLGVIAHEITERMRTEASLRESERRYRTLFDSLPIGVGIYDVDGRVLAANPTLLAIADPTGDNASVLSLGTSFVDPEEHRQLLDVAARHGCARNFEARLRRGDGTLYHASLNLDRIQLEGKEVLLASIQDISARKRMERLQQLQQELVLELNACTDLRQGLTAVLRSALHLDVLDCGGIYAADPEDSSLDLVTHVGLSREFVSRVAHFEPDSSYVRLCMSGKPVYATYKDIRPEEDDLRSREGLRAVAIIPVMSQNRLLAALTMASHKHDTIPMGTRVELESIAFHVGGSLLRLHTESALRASQARLESIINNSNTVIFLKDLRFRYLVVNRRYEELFHVTNATIAGKSDEELFPREHAEQFGRHDIQALHKGGPIEVEERFPQDDGLHTYLSTRFPVFDDEGRPVGVCGIATDITDRMRSEEALRKVQRLESLGMLASGIAHDFNNLLSVIFGNITLAMEGAKDDEAAGYLAKAMETIGRVRGLTGQLLTFARGGTPVKKLEQLGPFLQETTRFVLSGSNVTCVIEVADDLWPCECDKNQIGQVIDNIVINAQQAMPDGGVVVVTATNHTIPEKGHPSLTAGSYVRIAIEDRGIGMPHDILPRIFDPFYTTKTKGHGLGLATCFSIVTKHGGYIDVESVPGQGSTFVVYLPACPDGVVTRHEKGGCRHGSGTILVMDDEVPLLEVMARMLKALGYAVLRAENGRQAMALIQGEREAKRPIAAMIFDLTIPGELGGQELVAAVRSFDAKVPIFVASGYAEDPILAEPEKYGFTASLGKPFEMAELAGMLEKHLRGPKDRS